jgi:hypothetical protein
MWMYALSAPVTRFYLRRSAPGSLQTVLVITSI